MSRQVERLCSGFAWGAVLALGAILAGFVFFLGQKGLPTLGPDLLFGSNPAWEALTGRLPVWDGIWPACVGTLLLVMLASLTAIPLGIAAGIYLAAYASRTEKKIYGFLVDLLAGMPSILMGLFGFALILFLRKTLLPAANTGLLLAAGCLAFLVLPYLILTTQTALEGLPPSLQLTGLSLGLTPWQNLSRILLPAATRGIMSGVILAVGRAAEDTAVILLTGVVANAGLPQSWTDKFEALPFAIYYLAAEHRNVAELNRGFGAAVVLLLLTAFLFLWAYGLQRAFARRWDWRVELH